jgi:hypothetical protein
MPSTVKLPILGTVNKGTAVGVGVGGLAVAGYLIYHQVQKSKQQAAAAASASQAAANASGYGYGYGYGLNGPPDEYYGYGEPYGYGASGGFPAGYYGYGVVEPQAVANTTNAQWEQAAITQLTGEGYDAQTVSAALGAYTEGQSVTAAQQTIIQSAIGIEGYPPDPGANGYPPSINVQGTTGGGTGGGQGTGTTGSNVNVPNVVGQTLDNGGLELEGAGLKMKITSPKTRNHAYTYKILTQTPSAGSSAAKGSTVSVTAQRGAKV